MAGRQGARPGARLKFRRASAGPRYLSSTLPGVEVLWAAARPGVSRVHAGEARLLASVEVSQVLEAGDIRSLMRPLAGKGFLEPDHALDTGGGGRHEPSVSTKSLSTIVEGRQGNCGHRVAGAAVKLSRGMKPSCACRRSSAQVQGLLDLGRRNLPRLVPPEGSEVVAA